MHFCCCFKPLVLRLVQEPVNLLFVVLVEDIHPMLVQPLLGYDQWNLGIMRPGLLDAFLPNAFIVLQDFIRIQDQINVRLFPGDNGRICFVVILEKRCDPG